MNRWTALLALAGACVGALPVSGALIPIDPNNVTASSEITSPFDRKDNYLVDGSGLTAGAHVNILHQDMLDRA